MFSLVVARDVLHFFSPEDRAAILNRMFTSLMPGGTIYLRLNRINSPAIVRNQEWEKVGENSYAWNGFENEKCWLAGPEEVSNLVRDFRILSSDFEDRYRITVLARKD